MGWPWRCMTLWPASVSTGWSWALGWRGLGCGTLQHWCPPQGDRALPRDQQREVLDAAAGLSQVLLRVPPKRTGEMHSIVLHHSF